MLEEAEFIRTFLAHLTNTTWRFIGAAFASLSIATWVGRHVEYIHVDRCRIGRLRTDLVSVTSELIRACSSVG